MRWLFLVVALALSAAAVTAALWGADEPATAAGGWKLVVPNVAADSARRPTAVPTPTVSFDSERWVRIEIRIHALELAATGTGTLPVLIHATAEGRLPGAFDAPVTVNGTFTITPEGSDEVGCNWVRADSSTTFKVTFHYNAAGNLDALLGIVSPTWHYNITCPNGFTFRSPAFGEEGLETFLRDLMQPYRTSEVANGVRLPMTVVSAPNQPPCIKRSANFTGTGIQTRPAEVGVWVYQPDYPGGCNPQLDEFLAPLLP